MITHDNNSIDMLRNNAKTIGGVMGAEDAFLKKHEDDDKAFFVDRAVLDLQNLTFLDIERTDLGRSIKQRLV